MNIDGLHQTDGHVSEIEVPGMNEIVEGLALSQSTFHFDEIQSMLQRGTTEMRTEVGDEGVETTFECLEIDRVEPWQRGRGMCPINELRVGKVRLARWENEVNLSREKEVEEFVELILNDDGIGRGAQNSHVRQIVIEHG